MMRVAGPLAAAVAFLSCAEPPTAPEAARVLSLPLMVASTATPPVVISQLYGAGGNSGAVLTHDYVELFNPGSEPVQMTNWSLQYGSSSGTTWNNRVNFSGTIAAGGYFLVQLASGGSNGVPLPTADASGTTINMAAGAGKIVLVSNQTQLPGVACPTENGIVDQVSFGSTNCNAAWGSSPAASTTNAVFRADNGCRYTPPPAPSSDFTVGPPAPRNSSSPTTSCTTPAVVTTVEISDADTSLLVGETLALTAIARDADGEPVGATLTWSSSASSVASVSSTGVVTALAAGTAEIIVNAGEDITDTVTITVTVPPPPPENIDVVISQVYGGGGNAGSTWRNDFIELYNRGSEAVSLVGWSVQYASAAGTSWQVTPLSGTIEPGKYYLVQQAAGTGGTADLPTPDAVGTIAMAAGSAKVLLSSAVAAQAGACPVGASIVDRLTYGNSNCAATWGDGAPTISATLAALRQNDGCVNTGIAADDFVALAPNPRNSASPQRDCTEPPREQSDATILINELMGDPAAAENASWGEWFEVRNFGTSPVDLQGWRIISGGTSQPAHTITQSVVVPAGGYAVLGRGFDPARNGGVTLDYNYFVGSATTIWLDNADYLMLVDTEGLRVDSVAWTSLPRGVTKGLRPGLGRSPNVDGADWAYASTTFGEGDYGTPGAENAALVEVPPFVSPNRITFSGRVAADAPLPVGFEAQLFATLLDASNTSIPTVFTWESLTPAIASVDERGVIRALAPGEAAFRATATDGTARIHRLMMETPTLGNTSYADPAEFGLPVDDDPSDDVLITRREFTGSWNGLRAIPNWTAYGLVGEQVGAGADRCNCFTFDSQLEAQGFPRYNTADYTGAGAFAGYGIDRGHLVRSFDRTAGSADNAATYLFSNIIPQAADNNQGPWAQHEIYLGDLARVDGKELFIFAGASGSLGTVKGEGRITIPEYTWKVSVVAPRGTRLADVADYRDLQVIAVVMPNVPGIRNVPWQSYVVTADSVERLSGYRFLTALPEKTRRALVTGTQPPLGNIVAPTGTEGQSLTFSSAGSLDPNGTIVGYQWDFGDGNTASGATATHTYTFAGSYTAQLIVTDNDGLADTVTAAVAVAPVTVAEGMTQLRTALDELVAAAGLNRGQAQSLLAKWNALDASLKRGNAQAARGQLTALRNELRALVNSGRATAAQVAAAVLAIERLERAIP
ncbi:MAG: lamin tail domain-containing protein [Gemmatimonadaceae bacterium]|nr:lamin tail domain-containing protein [Gemmatimonadaceae bacterium]MCW5826438.1 lamin tail domain-containing protein [Gemmatimonadaceae bacterium]